ncbi:unnamed protein product [Lathyrus oleraceus]|uniref:uncharacterized protein LOC127112323 n=1 Tax=Pisum sativum TaxID=3888 RepID=UPI0021D1FC65|nr:uncharacterized protein LOC127112323 [Pisum sativum]KAI5382064.1 hypothetical protein KIW84_UN0199 [Pisum sativum]
MGYTKEQLLAQLKELQINFSQYEHPVILTVEEGEKYVGNLGGGLSKNLFLKDKKHRFYIVSASVNTKVDIKVLSQRLGLGKGGLRMAPAEALTEMLQVPLGCVTPFAVVNDSARDVVLLLDQGFKTHEFCFFHPLANDMTISLNAHDLDEFLKSIGKDPSYVDFEAIPVVSKDQPPDLAALVPSSSILVSHQSEMQPSSQVPADGNHASVENKSQIVSEQVFKPSISKKVTKEKPVNNGHSSNSFADVGPLVEEILHKASDLLLSEIKEDTIKQHGEHLGTVVSDNLREVLVSDLKNLAMIFKNSAYTEGFHAGIHHQSKHL